MKEQLLDLAIGIAIPLATTLITMIAKAVTDLIRAKVKSIELQRTLVAVTDAAETAVKDVAQSYLGSKRSSPLPANVAAEAKQQAMEKAKAVLGDVKVSDEQLSSRIEAAIHDSKAVSADPTGA